MDLIGAGAGLGVGVGEGGVGVVRRSEGRKKFKSHNNNFSSLLLTVLGKGVVATD